MTKRFCITLLALLLSFHVFSQQDPFFEYIGFLKLPDSSIITYKINFKESVEQRLEGYSVTDFYGTEKTKSMIKGSINKEKGIISFHEVGNLSTKSDAKANEFCYVHVKNAIIKSKNGKSTIQGKFQGKYETDVNCVSGSFYLIGTDFIASEDKTKKNAKNGDNEKAMLGLVKKTEENRLSSNDVLKLNWHSNKIILEIWDAALLDDDQINVFVNGKNILENFVITNKKKIIVLPFDEEVCQLKIVAVNEGKSLPNTVNILLKDNGLSTPVVTNLKVGESTSLVIQKSMNK